MAEKDVFLCPKNGIPHKENINMRCDKVKSKMVEYAKDLYLQGKGSLSLWASACGISPEIFFALLDQELEEDVENKYPVHQTSYTLSSKSNDDKGGRPIEEGSTNPSTLQTRANGSNDMPKPSVDK